MSIILILGVGVLGGGVPERAEEHVGAGLDDPARQALGAGPPVPAGRRPLAAVPLPAPLLRGRGRGVVGPAEIHLTEEQRPAPVSVSPSFIQRS